MNTPRLLRYWPLCLGLLAGCQNFFGDRTDLDFIDVPNFEVREVAYVPILPVITSDPDPGDGIPFRPTAMNFGFDQLLYVLDEGYNRVVAYDQAGREIGEWRPPGPRPFGNDSLVTRLRGGLVQDRRLDLLVLATQDTVISNIKFSLTTIFRLNLKGAGGYGLNFATVRRQVVHPFYLTASPDLRDQAVNFNGIAVLADNRYYVTRSGPRTGNIYGGGPEDAMLIFDPNDRFVTPIAVDTEGGTLRNFFRQPTAIASFIQPPQRFELAPNEDFFFTSLDPTAALRVRGISVLNTPDGISYRDANLPATGNPDQVEGFLYTPNRFERPVGITITGDGTNLVFVADATRDSVYQFSVRGEEGVPPPPGSSNPQQLIRTSFGGGAGETRFEGPVAVAYQRRILYVADLLPDGQGRILRFRLTTDFE